MSKYECVYCHSPRKTESIYMIDARRSVLDIQYYCGTVLKVIFPDGSHDWYKYCQGISSQRLDKSRKLPDN